MAGSKNTQTQRHKWVVTASIMWVIYEELSVKTSWSPVTSISPFLYF